MGWFSVQMVPDLYNRPPSSYMIDPLKKKSHQLNKEQKHLKEIATPDY